MPTRKAKGFYVDSKDIEKARTLHDLAEEIAYLRVLLKQFTTTVNPDEGLILAAINTLARALLAQSKLSAADPEKASARTAGVIAQLASILTEETP